MLSFCILGWVQWLTRLLLWWPLAQGRCTSGVAASTPPRKWTCLKVAALPNTCVQARATSRWWQWRRSFTRGRWVSTLYSLISVFSSLYPSDFLILVFRMCRVELKWWASWDTEIRPRTGSLKRWRSCRERPSDRWRVGQTSPPASLVG